MKTDSLKIASMAVFACLLWSTAFVAIKIGLVSSSPFYFAGQRFILAGLILLPFCGSLKKTIKEIVDNLRTVLLLSLFQTIILYGLFFFALTMTGGAIAAIVIGSQPIFASLVAHFLIKNDQMTIRNTVGVLIGVLGVVAISISRFTFSFENNLELIGMFMLVLGNVSSAFGNVIVSKARGAISPVVLSSAQMLLGGFVLLIMSLIFEGGNVARQLNLSYYISLLWLSGVSALAFSIWFKLLQTPGVKVSMLNTWKFIIPVSGATLSWVFLDKESPELIAILGIIFVSVSIYIIQKRNIKV